MEKETRYSSGKSVFRVSVISFVFLVIGYELALFTHRAAELRIQDRRDKPDTVFVFDRGSEAVEELYGGDCGDGAVVGSGYGESGMADAAYKYGSAGSGRSMVRKNAEHHRAVQRARAKNRKCESFRFNPNTISLEDLMRLGFSEKQAASIINYRNKGGRFARKSDFAKSYVVADSVFRRLEAYIDIPKVDINRADSAAFDALPGIGPFFASKMVKYREELGGYCCTEQLMEIWKFDKERFDGLKDLILCSPPDNPFDIWSADEQELCAHPHIRSRRLARAIVLYRNNTPCEQRSVAGLLDAGIIDTVRAEKLSRLINRP